MSMTLLPGNLGGIAKQTGQAAGDYVSGCKCPMMCQNMGLLADSLVAAQQMPRGSRKSLAGTAGGGRLHNLDLNEALFSTPATQAVHGELPLQGQRSLFVVIDRLLQAVNMQQWLFLSNSAMQCCSTCLAVCVIAALGLLCEGLQPAFSSSSSSSNSNSDFCSLDSSLTRLACAVVSFRF